MQGQESISVNGLRMDLVTGEWTAPKLWSHEKYGIGEMIDAINTDGKLWIIVIDFGEGPKKFRQDKLRPHAEAKIFKRFGKTQEPPAVEEEEDEGVLFLPENRSKKLPPMRRMSTEEKLRRLRAI